MTTPLTGPGPFAAAPPAPPAGRSPRAATLLRHAEACERITRHIDHHFAEPLTANALEPVALLSEFHLQRAFAQLTGYGIGAHLRRRRLERAMHLLVARSALGLDAVARASGLSCASSLVHLFRRELGMTPGAFRARAEQLELPPWRTTGNAAGGADGGPGLPLLGPVHTVTLAPRPIVTMTAFGARARHFADTGFDAADRFVGALRALPDAAAPWPLRSVYPERALGPADPTQRLVLAADAVAAGSASDVQLRLRGLARATLPGGCYVVVGYDGAHQHTWMAWSRVRHGGLLAGLGLRPRERAPVFESVEAFGERPGGRERLGVRLWLPVHEPAATPEARQDRDAEDRQLMTGLVGQPLNLADRLSLQRA